MPPGLGPGAVAEFLNPVGKANGGGGAFDAAFAGAFGVGAVSRPPPAAAAAGRLPSAAATPLARLNPSLSAFVGAARSSGAAFSFRPPPPNSEPPPPLAVPDACRLRDRAETLARQLGASAPQAQEQVAKLLWSVGVDPARLPPPMASLSRQRLSSPSPSAAAAASSSVAPAAWEAAWREGQRMQHPAAAAEAAAAARAAAERFGGNGGGGGAWANEFSRLNLSRGPRPPPPMSQTDSWASEFAAGMPPAEAWANDFASQLQQRQQSGAASSASASALAASDAAANANARAQSRALADALSADPNMRSSKFLSFVSKMSRGEIVLEGNEAKPADAAAVGGAWDEQHSSEAFDGAWTEAATANEWANQHHQRQQQQQQQQQKSVSTPTQRDWADQFAAGVAPQGLADQWASEFEARRRDGGFGGGAGVGIAEGGAQQQQQRSNNPSSPSSLLVDDGGSGPQYEFSTARTNQSNPFDADPDPLETARRLFRTGVLSEAALAAEAQIRRKASSGDGGSEDKTLAAWRLLGAIHAENDDDRQAIAALRQAHAAAPGDGDVLLSLGVSHTNELDRGRALAHLSAWLRRAHPEAAARHLPPFPEAQQNSSLPPSQTVTLEAATAAFEAAAASAPPASSAAADASAALGVLRSLGRDFEGAAVAFRRALDARPDDYSLW